MSKKIFWFRALIPLLPQNAAMLLLGLIGPSLPAADSLIRAIANDLMKRKMNKKGHKENFYEKALADKKNQAKVLGKRKGPKRGGR